MLRGGEMERVFFWDAVFVFRVVCRRVGMGCGKWLCSCWFELREFWFGRRWCFDGRNVLEGVGKEVVVL